MLRAVLKLAPPLDDGAILLVIENAEGRAALVKRAEVVLAAGSCLVKIVDVVGLRRSVRTTPKDPRVRLVAREAPAVLRGGLTSMVSYYLAPEDALDATETHSVGEAFSHEYQVLLSVVRVGRRDASASVAA